MVGTVEDGVVMVLDVDWFWMWIPSWASWVSFARCLDLLRVVLCRMFCGCNPCSWSSWLVPLRLLVLFQNSYGHTSHHSQMFRRLALFEPLVEICFHNLLLGFSNDHLRNDGGSKVSRNSNCQSFQYTTMGYLSPPISFSSFGYRSFVRLYRKI